MSISVSLPTKIKRKRQASDIAATVGLRWTFVLGLLVVSAILATPALHSERLVPVGAVVLLAGAGLLWACFAFVARDGGYVTPSNMVFAGLAVVVFFPVLFLSIQGTFGPIDMAPALSFMAAGAATGVSLYKSPNIIFEHRNIARNFSNNYNVLLFAAFGVFGLGWFLFRSETLLRPIGAAALIGSGLVFAVVSTSQFSSRRWFVATASACGSGLALGIWYTQAFTSFGRLNVAAIALSIISMWLLWFPSRLLKTLAILSLPLSITWAAMARGSESLESVWREGSGLGSVFHPAIVFREISRHSSDMSMTWQDWGLQLITTLFFWVPRDWWPSKAEGTGRQLVHEFWPELASSGHSVSASWVGEGMAYGGSVGLVLAALFFIAVVRVADKVFWSSANRSNLLLLASATWAGAHLVSYLWGGVFSYASRIGLVVIPLLVLALLATRLRPASLTKAT